MAKDLRGKTAVITGAANGLGKALAKELYKQGCNLALLDIDTAGLEKLQAGFSRDEQTVSVHTVDIAKEAEVAAVRASILGQHARVDILINNAAVSISEPFEQMDITDYRWLFEINFWGTIYCTKYFLPDLLEQKNSRLVNIISDFALMGFPGKTSYGSSKSAVMGFTNALRTELEGKSVKVSLVIPPPLDTGIVKNGKHVSEQKKNKEALFLQNNGKPIDITARKIVDAVNKGKYRIIISPMIYWADAVSRFFPTLLHKWIGRNKNRFDFT